MKRSLERLEEIIGYRFRDISLLKTALTHPSYSAEAGLKRCESNQRLEFLGDAVIELSVSSYLFRAHPFDEEGELTRKRASLVFENALFVCARDIGLGDFLYLGVGEAQSDGQSKPSILSDAFEALTGAIYLDGGIEEADRFIHERLISKIEELSLSHDGKSLIQQYAQRSPRGSVEYRTAASGADGFRSELFLNGKFLSEGTGRSKKMAEQEAAIAGCRKLNIE